MANRLVFDDEAPSVPISRDNTTPEMREAARKYDAERGGPAPPISQSNMNPEEQSLARARTLVFDAPETEAQKSVARVRDIAGKMKAGAPTPGPLDFIADAATLSTSRPISAAAGAALGGLTGAYPGSSFGERYEAGTKFMNDRISRAAEATGPIAPIVGSVAQLPATMLTGGGAAPLTTRALAGRSAAAGAVEGASQNAGDLASAATGGLKNAAASATTTALLDRFTRAALPAARRGAEAEARAAMGDTPDQVRGDARALYRQLDNSGVSYDASQTAPLYVALHDMRNRAQYSPNAHPALTDYFDQLMTLSRGPATYTQLQDLRSAFATQTRSPDADTRRAAGDILGHIDGLIRTPPAINPNGLNMAQIHPEASRLWRAASLADDAGWTAGKTERKQAVKSGVNPDEVTRSNFARVEERVSRPGAYDPFSQEQRDLLAQIVRGGTIQNAQNSAGEALRGPAARFAGGAAGIAAPAALGLKNNVDPYSLAAVSGASGAVASGAVNSLGKLLQRSAAERGQRDVAALLRNITNSPPPTPGAAITRGDLAQIMFGQDIARHAPRIGSVTMGPGSEEQRY